MAGLNAFAPSHINAYPSMLHRLALEAGAGRLRIAPLELSCGAEPLLPEARRAIEAAFAVPIINTYACSEVGVMARLLPGGGGGGPHDGMEQWPDRGAQQQAEAGQARNVRARRLSPAPAARAANRLSSRAHIAAGVAGVMVAASERAPGRRATGEARQYSRGWPPTTDFAGDPF